MACHVEGHARGKKIHSRSTRGFDKPEENRLFSNQKRPGLTLHVSERDAISSAV